MNMDTGEQQVSSELDKVRPRVPSPLRTPSRRCSLPHHYAPVRPTNKVYVEIALMEQLVHPHCVELLSAIDDDDNGLLYLVMEHVDGAAIMEVAPSRADGRHSYYSPVTGGVLTEMTIVAAMHDVISGLE